MNKSIVYSFIPVGAALVAGGIQTAIIGYSFGAGEWYIAALLIACVWLTAGMDAAAFHHSATAGATWMQKIFLALSAISLVVVLAVDLVWMFAPDAFNTSDTIIKDLSYATGINLAVSVFCLLAWIFFSQDHQDEREAAEMEANARREQRLRWLESDEAARFFGEDVRQEHIERIAKRRRRAPFAIAGQGQSVKVIDQTQTQQAALLTREQLAQIVDAIRAAEDEAEDEMPLSNSTPRVVYAPTVKDDKGHSNGKAHDVNFLA